MGNFFTTANERNTDAGDLWREKAQQYNDKRSQCLEKSQIAYQQGNHEMAKKYSEQGKAFGTKMDDANEKAATIIFDSLNKVGRHPPRTYDFHGLHVKEAVKKLEDIVKVARKQEWTDVTIIVGRGNHSLNGIAKLPSTVEEFALAHSDIISSYRLDYPTKGCILLQLKEKGNFCIIQ